MLKKLSANKNKSKGHTFLYMPKLLKILMTGISSTQSIKMLPMKLGMSIGSISRKSAFRGTKSFGPL